MALYRYEKLTADDYFWNEMRASSIYFISVPLVGDKTQPALEMPDIDDLWETYGWDLEYLKGTKVPESAFTHAYAEYVYFYHEEKTGKITKNPAVNLLFSAICTKCDLENQLITTVGPALKHEDVKLERYKFTFDCHPAPEYAVRFFTPLVIDPQNIEYPGVVAATKRLAGKVGSGVRDAAGRLRRKPRTTYELPDWSGEPTTGETTRLDRIPRKRR